MATFVNCNPTICGKNLMSDDHIYMDRELIKEKCICISKNIYIRIVELLQANRKKDALDLIQETNAKT